MGMSANNMKSSSSKVQMISAYRERAVQKALREYCQAHRFNVLVCHRRMGKTVFAINMMIRKVLTCAKINPRAHYFAPTYKQAKSIAWDYLQMYTQHIEGMEYNKTELAANFPTGQRIQLVGADNPDSFRGQYSDFTVLDEVAMFPVRMWSEVIRPALADRDGGALFIGTPAGRNIFYDLFERAKRLDDWGAVRLSYKDTGLIPAREINAMRQEMEDFEFDQELGCSFNAAVRGAYFGKVMAQAEQEGRITRVPYDQALPVFTCWDLGMADATAIWFIQVSPGGEVRAIDYEEFHNAGIPEIITAIRAKGYERYDMHIAPHDIRVRELGTGTSRYEVAQTNGVRFHIARNMPLMDGIDATRNLIRKMWFDEDNCRLGINALQLYRAELNQKTGVLNTRPLHDHTSHGADALRMFAVERGQRGASKWASDINYDMLDRAAV